MTSSTLKVCKKFVARGAIALSAASLVLSFGTAQADGVTGKLLGGSASPSASALANAKPIELPRATTAQLKAAGVLNADGSIAKSVAPKRETRASASARGAMKGSVGAPALGSVQVIPNPVAPPTTTSPVAPMAYGDGDWPFTTSRVELTGKMLFSKVYPYRAAGKLFIQLSGGGSGWCSAALVGRGILVTAAHCVADFGSGFMNASWYFAPGYFNGKAAQKPVPAVYIVAPTTFLNGTDTCAAPGIVCPNDVAVIVLANSRGQYVGDKVGWFGVGYNGYGFTSTDETQVTQLGYPSGIDYGSQMLRNDSGGLISGSGYSFNTVIGSQMNEGSSGGPWINNFGMAGYPNGVSTPYAAASNVIIGVTSWGYTDGITDVVGASPFNSGNVIALLNDACTQYPAACGP